MNSPFSPPYAQTQSFLNQLEGGIRYFDLRLKWESANSFRFVHGSWNTTAYLNGLLDALITFYADPIASKEVVILDFAYFEEFDTDEKKQDLINELLNSSIADKFAPKSNSQCTLNSLWTANKNIILSCNSGISQLDKNGLIWNGGTLFASGWSGTKFWSDTNDLSDMVSFLNNIVEGNYNDLWVLQNILTPRWYSSSIKILSLEATPSLYKTLESNKNWETKSNIVIIDYNSNDLRDLHDLHDLHDLKANLKHLDNQLCVYALVINWKRFG